MTALLLAYHDVLDYDGLKSILKEANMLFLKDIKNINPDDTLDFFSFKKIIAAQNILLYMSENILKAIGRKFSFYLFPFGKDFDEIVREINDLIKTDWKVEILNRTEEQIDVRVEKCIFCSEIGDPCDLMKGFLIHSLEKTLPSNIKVTSRLIRVNINDSKHNSFDMKLILSQIKH